MKIENYLEIISRNQPLFKNHKRFIIPSEPLSKTNFDSTYPKEIFLPFNKIFLEYSSKIYYVAKEGGEKEIRGLRLGVGVQDLEEMVGMMPFFSLSGKPHYGEWYIGNAFFLPRKNAIIFEGDKAKLLMSDIDGKPLKTDDFYKRINIIATDLLFRLLKELNKPGVILKKKSPKRKKGKKPPKAYNSYWIYTVKHSKVPESKAIERPHVSPREHDRRAYERTIQTKNGPKRIKVRATVVNRGKGGKVYKDYTIDPEKF